MSSGDLASSSTTPSEGKIQYQVIKAGGYDSSKHFMESYNLRLYNDDDVQLAKILSHSDEHNRANANDQTCEIDSYSNSDSDSSCDAHVGHHEVVWDDEGDSDEEEGSYAEGAYSYHEWGLDEPEFEGHPAYSDSEEGYDSDQGGRVDEPVFEDYSEDEDYTCDEDGW
jgi:hypothetical protein